MMDLPFNEYVRVDSTLYEHSFHMWIAGREISPMKTDFNSDGFYSFYLIGAYAEQSKIPKKDFRTQRVRVNAEPTIKDW